MSRGLLLAAPASGSGKTVLTLALLRALRRRGVALRSAKSGPDYIDPDYHRLASGSACVNLDGWAMSAQRLAGLAANGVEGPTGPDAPLLVVEGAMGLFDGAVPDAAGSSAALAKTLGLPVVLIVDCARQGQSVAALISGFARFDPDLHLAGVLLNRVGSERHAQMLQDAIGRHLPDLPVLGCVYRSDALALPDRHLGLVQAREHADIDAFLDGAATELDARIDIRALVASAAPVRHGNTPRLPLRPPGQRIAVARDDAFAFAYPHLLQGWRDGGASISFFSPLADDAPDEAADAVYLPGGYPELHAGRLAAAGRFRAAMRSAAERGLPVYGECGGFMVLGQSLTDADGTDHPMLGLLDLETDFSARRRQLGYRRAVPRGGDWFGSQSGPWRAHEFHYATIRRQAGMPLFEVSDAAGTVLGPAGLQHGSVSGSFIHLIAPEEDAVI
ncbi:cobyrinate a,c-diamide synthase [Oceanomicrobium pacificus]|uniref:Hydrogenobyrinate a,c-diamide synthase n=1 Tax=Oceanomicrobium pacificus TaxID=2692916 RepID=A0A6B0TPT2_9RHOB|nr:cobyrinate a,c-diamide synthase [Oceanomicrobium pacificus]MXU65936.1 cobyrinate a,c-diamide synthase [Oceanomicrobium pacificus]